METRLGKITACKAGGTASNGSKTYKITLPSAWVKVMDPTGENRNVLLSFNGDAITICPKQDPEQYRQSRLKQGHELLEIRFYNDNDLCTLIYADKTTRDICAENYTEQVVKTAFGKNSNPSWEDLELFLEERCIPRQRAGLRDYLETLGLDEYNPIDIIKKTKGRMAEDNQWLEVYEVR